MTVTLTGTNSFGLRAELERLVSAFVDKYGDMGLEKLDAEEVSFERVQEALQSLPFLASKKMVALRTPSANKKFVEHAERLLQGLPETTDLVIVEPKLDKRSSYYKLLKKATDFREYLELDASGLASWLVAQAKADGGRLSLADASFLVERVGTSQQLLGNELEKLLLYDPNITRGIIELLSEAAPQSTVFELLEAAFAGNTKRALELYDEQRALKVEPQQIIAMLAWQLHVLALIKTAGERSPQAIAAEAKINPFVVRKSSTIARKLRLDELKQRVADLLDIDVRLKRESIDADEALRNYLLQISR